MADPEVKCADCDQICINPFNPDEECWGRMSAEERQAFLDYLVHSGESPNASLQVIINQTGTS